MAGGRQLGGGEHSKDWILFAATVTIISNASYFYQVRPRRTVCWLIQNMMTSEDWQNMDCCNARTVMIK